MNSDQQNSPQSSSLNKWKNGHNNTTTFQHQRHSNRDVSHITTQLNDVYMAHNIEEEEEVKEAA